MYHADRTRKRNVGERRRRRWKPDTRKQAPPTHPPDARRGTAPANPPAQQQPANRAASGGASSPSRRDVPSTQEIQIQRTRHHFKAAGSLSTRVKSSQAGDLVPSGESGGSSGGSPSIRECPNGPVQPAGLGGIREVCPPAKSSWLVGGGPFIT
jgi:hypothetical protein